MHYQKGFRLKLSSWETGAIVVVIIW